MRLLMLSWRYLDHPGAGGAETLTHEVLRRLAAAGHSVTCFTAEYPGSRPTGEIDGVRLLRRGQQWSVHLHAARWLARRLDDYDIVIDQVNTIPFLTPWYVPLAQRRLFICQLARGYWFRETRGIFRLAAPAGYLLEPSMIRRYRGTRAVTISQSSREDLVALGLRRDDVHVIPMALTRSALPQLGPKRQPFRMIIVGRLTPAKFVEEGVQTFVRVAREVPEATLDIVGSGDPGYRAELEAVVHRGGVSGVTFHGRVDEVRRNELLAAAHVHVFASHREGWGLTVSEAAAMGTPSVGYDVSGVRDSVADPRLLAPVGDVATLSERVLRLVRDTRLYDEVRQAAWQRVRGMSYEATADAFAGALGIS